MKPITENDFIDAIWIHCPTAKQLEYAAKDCLDIAKKYHADMMEESLNKDVTGFAEWMDKEHYTQVLNQFHPEVGKWCKRGSAELHRQYFSISELLSKYKETKSK